MIATTEKEMLAEVIAATGLPEDLAREIVASELGFGGDSIPIETAADEDLSDAGLTRPLSLS